MEKGRPEEDPRWRMGLHLEGVVWRNVAEVSDFWDLPLRGTDPVQVPSSRAKLNR